MPPQIAEMIAKVHITIHDELVGDPSVIERVVSVAKLTDLNAKRASEYGLISGWMDTDLIGAVEQLPEVEAVALDGTKRISSPN